MLRKKELFLLDPSSFIFEPPEGYVNSLEACELLHCSKDQLLKMILSKQIEESSLIHINCMFLNGEKLKNIATTVQVRGRK